MPVVVGTHDVGPWLQVVHAAGRVSDHEESTERILHQRSQLAPVLRDAQAEETARDLRELRSKLRGYGFFSRSPERKAAEVSAAAKVAVVCQQAGLPLPTRSIGQMGGKEFEQLLLALRAPVEGLAPSGPEPDWTGARLGQHVVGVDQAAGAQAQAATADAAVQAVPQQLDPADLLVQPWSPRTAQP